MGSRSRLILSALTLVLLVGVPGWAVASPLPPPAPTSGPTPPAAPLRASPHPAEPAASGAAWNPWSGRSSPGSPHYTLSSASLASGGCNATYSGEAWMAFDVPTRSFWVAAAPACVEVFNATGIFSAVYAVGSDPFGVAVDDAHHEVYVTDSGSDNVSVLNDSTGAAVASIPVGTAPAGIGVDPSSGLVFVANNGSANVSVINATLHRVVANVPVGRNPIGVAVDPVTQRAFVASSGSDNLSVISTTSLTAVASIAVGSEPFGVALDNLSDRIFVTNRGSNTLSVVDPATDTVADSVAVVSPAVDLQGVAFDPLRDLVWVGGGSWFAVVVNASTDVVAWYLSVDPSGVAVDPSTGTACLTNTANRTFLCIGSLTQFGVWGTASLNVTETGLAPGTIWSVTVDGLAFSGGQPSLRFGLLKGFYSPASYPYAVPAVAGLVPSPSQGNVTVYDNTTSIQVNVTFAAPPATYPVTFSESGLPTGTVWGVSVGGTACETGGTALTFAEANGTYGFSVLPVSGYRASPASGTVSVAGGPVNVTVSFSPAPPPVPLLLLTFSEVGLPAGTGWTVTVDASESASATPSVTFSLPSGLYVYAVGSPPGYRASPSNGTVLLTANLTVSVGFERVYALTFSESGLPAGARWAVTVEGTNVSTLAGSVVFSVPAGNHSFGVSAIGVAYRPAPASGTIGVFADTVVPVVFSVLYPPTALYPLTFTAVNASLGTGWMVIVDGLPHSTNRSALTVSVGNGSHSFQVLPVARLVAVPASGTVQVAGGAVNVTVYFWPAPIPCSGYGCPATMSPGAGPPPPGVWLAVIGAAAAVGVAAGAVLGYVLAGRRRAIP